MITKKINDLQTGDNLKCKKNLQIYQLKQIIKKDNKEPENNYGFDGFFVKEKIMKKFFESDNEGLFVF
jgi:hypothetical protein